MTNAYYKNYLSDVMKNLGEAFDFAYCTQNLTLNQFISLFINSGVATFFENGNPKYVNIPGAELVFEVLSRSGISIKDKSINCKCMCDTKNENSCNRTAEYWCGWILAYYQWYSGKTFNYIQQFLPVNQIREMYYPLHEANENKFVAIANSIIKGKDTQSKLKRIRRDNGLTQKELALRSYVNIRTIQQYENMSKDIKKSRGDILLHLARTLNCKIEELIE